MESGAMMRSMMKQIRIKIGHARLIFTRSTELWNFQNRLGPVPTDDVNSLTL